MKKALTIAAVLEVATGTALLIVPSLIGRLLFGEEFTGIVIAVARVLGIALLALGVGCLPGSTALCGMCDGIARSISSAAVERVAGSGSGLAGGGAPSPHVRGSPCWRKPSA